MTPSDILSLADTLSAAARGDVVHGTAMAEAAAVDADRNSRRLAGTELLMDVCSAGLFAEWGISTRVCLTRISSQCRHRLPGFQLELKNSGRVANVFRGTVGVSIQIICL